PSNKRLLLMRATSFQPNSESRFKMRRELYQLSNSTSFGQIPHSAASLNISCANSTFDLPPFCHKRIETGILRLPSVQISSTTCMPWVIWPALLDQTQETASECLARRSQV